MSRDLTLWREFTKAVSNTSNYEDRADRHVVVQFQETGEWSDNFRDFGVILNSSIGNMRNSADWSVYHFAH